MPSIFQPLKTSMLYVKEFKDDDVTNEELYNHFKSYYPDGEIVSCEIGYIRKFAYVNYVNHEQATTAITLLNSTIFRNTPLLVKFSHKHRDNTGSIIYIENFDKSLDNDYLHKLVSPFGNTLVIKIDTDASGQSTGSAAVQYDSVETAQTALKHLNGKLIMNKKLHVYSYSAEKKRGDEENGNGIFLDIVPDFLSEEYLWNTFIHFGAITKVSVYDDFPKGGFCGSVVFKDPAAAAEAAKALKIGFDRNLEFIRIFRRQSQEESTEEEASGSALNEVPSQVKHHLTLLAAQQYEAMSQISSIQHFVTHLKVKQEKAMSQLEQLQGYLGAPKKRKVDKAFGKTKLDVAVHCDHVMAVEQSFTV